jgi:hypothetical protein
VTPVTSATISLPTEGGHDSGEHLRLVIILHLDPLVVYTSLGRMQLRALQPKHIWKALCEVGGYRLATGAGEGGTHKDV